MERGSDKKVLVVEDDKDILFIVRLALRRAGCQVETASDGQAALEALPYFKPGLILLDMRMPRMDGWEFSRALREMGYAIPIVIITGAPDPSQVAQEIGAVGWLTKPFDLQDLIRAVETKIGAA